MQPESCTKSTLEQVPRKFTELGTLARSHFNFPNCVFEQVCEVCQAPAWHYCATSSGGVRRTPHSKRSLRRVGSQRRFRRIP